MRRGTSAGVPLSPASTDDRASKALHAPESKQGRSLGFRIRLSYAPARQARIAPESKPGRTLGFRVRLRTRQKGKQVGGVRLRIAPESKPGRTLGC